MKKKLIALFLFVMLFGLQINMKAFASTLDISKEVYVSGPTFGNSDVDGSYADIQEIKLKTNLTRISKNSPTSKGEAFRWREYVTKSHWAYNDIMFAANK